MSRLPSISTGWTRRPPTSTPAHGSSPSSATRWRNGSPTRTCTRRSFTPRTAIGSWPNTAARATRTNPSGAEYRMIARDGTVHWFLDEATVIRDETGRPAYFHGFLLDITEQRQLAEALRSSEQELRRQKRYVESLVEINPTAIVTVDRDGSVTSWNLAAQDLFGYAREEAIGRKLDDLVTARNDLRGAA